MTHDRLPKFLYNVSQCCFGGCTDWGILLYICLTYPVAACFLILVYDMLCSVLHTNLAWNPWGTHLHKSFPHLNKYQSKLAGYVLLAARKTLARAWRWPLIKLSEVSSEHCVAIVAPLCMCRRDVIIFFRIYYHFNPWLKVMENIET